MATTLKLKKKPPSTPDQADRPAAKPGRPPVRGAGSGPRRRPTLAEAQAQRAEREASWQARQEEQRRPQPSRSGPRPAARGTGAEDPRGAPRPGRSGSAQGGGRPAQRRPDDNRHHERGAARPAAARDEQPPQRPPSRRPPAFEPPPAPDAPRRSPNTAFGRTGPKAFEPAAKSAPPRRGMEQPPTGRQAGDDHAPPRQPHRAPRPSGPAPRDREERGLQRARGTVSPEAPAADPSDHAPGSMRLSKRIGELGLASRREADEWIEKGWVRVDGQVVRELGSRVLPGQAVTIDSAARQQQARQVTVLLNKPIGFVSGQAEDGYEPAFVLVLPQNQWREDGSGVRFSRDHLRSLVPAGRLDIDSSGLLVLTQDGRVAKALIGENSPVEKEYLVRVQSLEGDARPQQALSPAQLARLNHGLELDGEALRPAKVEWVNEDQLRFVLVEGKKRQIRRMCEAVGLKVTGLKRVRIGRVMLGDLPVGQWRYLRGDEAF